MELQMDALTKMISDSAEKVMKEKSDALKAEIIAATKTETAALEKKILFPNSEEQTFSHGGVCKTMGGSVVDFGCMKSLAGMNLGPDSESSAMGVAFSTMGGPWKSLSPVMTKFAKMLTTGFKSSGLTRLGGMAFLEDYAKECAAQISQTKTAPVAQSEGTNADGGFVVPIEFAAVVVEFAFNLSPIVAKVWRVSMNTSVVKYPKLSQQEGNYFGGVSIQYANEATAPTATTKVKFEQNVFTAHKVLLETAFTSELVEDSLINIVNYVTGVITRAYMYELERCVIRGSGSGQPLGIIEDPIVKANAVSRSSGANKIAIADIYNLEGKLDEMFTNLSYITRRSTVAALRSSLTTTNAAFMHESWEQLSGAPTMTKVMNGFPYYVTRNCHATGSIGDMICGDLGYYMMAIRRDMRIDMSDAPYWTTDQIALRLTARYDGMPGSSFAFKILAGSGS